MDVIVLVAPEPPSKSERAIKAAKVARKHLPSVTAFVRMLTNNPRTKVAWTGGTPRTDGETVWLRVPIGLGDERDHDRKVCGRRGADLIQQCEACAAEEDMWITMFHECAHVIFGTFEAVAPEEQVEALRLGIQTECDGNAGSKRAELISRRIDQNFGKARNYLGLAGLVSPFLPMLINACEDIRVNLLMKEARPGTHVMFAAQTNSVFERGIEQEDGSTFKWDTAPPNAQAMIAVYCKTSSLDYSSWLDPKVVADLDDPQLDAVIGRMQKARSIKAVYRLAFPLLEELRRLGYMRHEDDPEDVPPQEDDQPQQGGGEQGDSDDTQDENEDGDDDESGAGGDDQEQDDESGDQGDDGQGDDEGDEAEGEDEGDGGTGDDADDGESEQSQEGNGQGEQGKGDTPSPEAGSDRGDPGSELDQYEDDGGRSEKGDEPDDFNGSENDGTGTEGGGETKPEDMGTAEEVERIVMIFGRHDDEDGIHRSDPEGFDSRPVYDEEGDDESAVEKALNQAEYFDRPSERLEGLRVYRYNKGGDRADDDGWGSSWPDTTSVHELPVVPERILAPALQHLRIAFAENRRSQHDRNRRSGRIDARVLGRRVPVGDDRLFGKKTLPGKRDHFIVVGLDVSGSTAGREIRIIKAAAYAKAELLNRLGVKFAVYAHTGRSRTVGIYEVKGPDEPWGDPQRQALAALESSGGNYDGHSLEFYRKVAEKRHETDRHILYYTDGALNNIGEEFSIFTENVEICKRQNITIVGVEIGVDSGITEQVGLDTIRLDTIEDVPRVVKELQKRLQ